MTKCRYSGLGHWILGFLVLACVGRSSAQSRDTLQLSQRVLQNAQVEVYKHVGQSDLRISIVYPPDHQAGQTHPALVLFYGGGWIRGRVTQFDHMCRYFASRGMIAMSVDYRVTSRQKSTAFESVQDARSAMRWVKRNAGRLGIEPERIVAGGGSAGGHLALATAILDEVNEPGEDTLVNPKPSALVLFNPVTKTTEGGYGHDRLGVRAEALSPVAHVRPGVPPTIIFHGEADATVPIQNAAEFCERMKKAGNSCVLHRFPGQKHGLANDTPGNAVVHKQIIDETDVFLTAHGYLAPKTITK
jgi:acetyl esterase